MSWKERFEEKQKLEKDKPAKGKKNAPEMSAELYKRYENMTFFQEISESFKLFFTNLHILLLVFVGIAIFISLLSVFVFTDLNWFIYEEYVTMSEIYAVFGETSDLLPSDISTDLLSGLTGWQQSILNRKLIFDFIQGVIKFVPFILGGLVTANYLTEKAKGQKASLGESIKLIFSKERIRVTILVLLTFTPVIAFGIAMLIIPGVGFLLLLGYAIFMVPKQKFGFIDTIKASFNYSEDFRWKSFMLISIGVTFYLVIGNWLRSALIPFYTQQLYLEWFNPATRNWFLLIYYDLSLLGPQGLLQPLILCFIAVQYIEIGIKKGYTPILDNTLIKGKRTGVDGEVKAELKAEKLTKKNIAHNIKSKGGQVKYYCPGCGQRVMPDDKKDKSIVKCKNCGMRVFVKKVFK